MGGGGGGNDGYERQQAATEAKKQAARDALNAQFGQGLDVGQKPAPTRADFNGPGYAQSGGLDMFGPVDQVLGDKALADATASYQANKDSTPVADARAARESMYSTVRDNAFTAGKRSLDEGRDQAKRNLKFELFAKGLNGGSTDIDQNALLGRTYNQGVIDLGAKADSAKADFRNADEQTRMGLLQSIDSGMDQGSALSSAISQLGVNSDKAAAEANGTTLGDLFANSALLYNKSQAAQGAQAGQQAFNMFGQRNLGASPMRTNGATGTVTTTG
jgi:hypothetical protein